MALWRIQPSKEVDAALRYYKSDKAVSNNYDRLIKELESSSNPASIGIPKKKASMVAVLVHTSQNLLFLFTTSTIRHTGSIS